MEGGAGPVIVRPARPEEVDIVADLWLDSRLASIPANPAPVHDDADVHRYFREEVFGRHHVLVADNRADVVGMMSVLDGWVEHLHVRPGRTGAGIGSLLIGRAKEMAAWLRLWTFQTNAGARRFYERHGFASIRFTAGDNEEGAPDVCYEWRAPRMAADYDSDAGRWGSMDPSSQAFGDVHQPVAARLAGVVPVLDVGGGDGRLQQFLPTALVVDRSPAQLGRLPTPGVLGDARRLPVAAASVGAVTMLWMLYHLDDPTEALAEARRVLRPDGVLVACTSSRTNDPELVDGYPPTPFDAEEAPEIVASVFGTVDIERWDAPMTILHDRDDVLRYCRSHSLPAACADRVDPPVWLTKRGCLIYAWA